MGGPVPAPDARKLTFPPPSVACLAPGTTHPDPLHQEELGVHPNKVKDVAGWLDEAYNPKLSKYRRLLVLSGPAGAGKTATLGVLAREGEIDILEYKNSHNLQFASLDRKYSTLTPC